MTREQLSATILEALGEIAPEAVSSEIDPRLNLREQLDLDSMDFLNFVIALHKKLGVSIPETDYSRLATLDGAIDYLLRNP